VRKEEEEEAKSWLFDGINIDLLQSNLASRQSCAGFKPISSRGCGRFVLMS